MSKIHEFISGSSSQSSEQQAQVRDAVWQSLIYKHLFIKKARAAGIFVGDDEIVDMTTGSNLSLLLLHRTLFLWMKTESSQRIS